MDTDALPDLSIITISHNHRRYVETCLRSIYAHETYVRLEVIVVDNASTDGTSALIRTDFPQARLIRNERPRGYAANNNLGIHRARGRYPLILNPDVRLLPGALSELVSFMDAVSDVGLAGPKLLNADMSLQYSCRRFSTPAHLLIRGLHLDGLMAGSRLVREAMYMDWDHDDVRDVDYVTGAAMIVRREALAQVGLLDEGFQLYFEDQDWCYRMWQHDWRVAYVPTSQMIHDHQRASARGLLNKATRTHIQSMIRFFAKHHLPRPMRIASRGTEWHAEQASRS